MEQKVSGGEVRVGEELDGLKEFSQEELVQMLADMPQGRNCPRSARLAAATRQGR